MQSFKSCSRVAVITQNQKLIRPERSVPTLPLLIINTDLVPGARNAFGNHHKKIHKHTLAHSYQPGTLALCTGDPGNLQFLAIKLDYKSGEKGNSSIYFL